LEPEGNRAKENLANVQVIMKGNVTQTGKKNITINVSPEMLGDTTEEGGPNENSFMSTDLLLAMDAALDYDKKYKKNTEVQQFIRKFESVCSSLKESQKDNFGFFWKYYVPYFIEMKEKNFVETFAYLAFASSDDETVLKWLNSHKSDIDKFYDWSKSFAWKTN
jgi:hypothetical protein